MVTLATRRADATIDRIAVAAYTIPTETLESDGTYEWDSTTLVIVEAQGGGRRGLGYTYADTAAAKLIEGMLAKVVTGHDAMSVEQAWIAMVRAVRNLGRPGIASMAISAVDAALWDLKARLLDLPLVRLLGQVRKEVLAYGSGGFTSYTMEQLTRQLGGWAQSGLRQVKMKIGRDPQEDPKRVCAAKQAIGPGTELFVDANGAYDRKQALSLAERFAEWDVRWFEEPVSSDDLDGLRLLRDRAPAPMRIAAGEYGYDLFYFRRMLQAGAVDVLQADATRCGGITGFLKAAVLCEAAPLPMSAHTAPSLHVHPCCAVEPMWNVEYFYDHVWIEHIFFEGAATAIGGALRPDLSRPGLGLELKRADAERYAV